jgi:hypothetical protein
LLPLREVLLPICFSCCCLLDFATVPAFVPGRLGIMVCCAAPLGKNQYETAGRTGANGLFQRLFNI